MPLCGLFAASLTLQDSPLAALLTLLFAASPTLLSANARRETLPANVLKGLLTLSANMWKGLLNPSANVWKELLTLGLSKRPQRGI